MPASTHSNEDITPTTPFKTISIKKLHPTFAAEVTNVDFQNGITDEQMDEILAAITKYGVLVFRNTGLDDTGHVEFSRHFGELDDIKPYLTNGRKPRFPYLELFDAGNLDDEGRILEADSTRAHYGKVSA